MSTSPLPLATGTNIWKWIPQRPPMVLIDTIWETTPKHARASLTIEPNTPFVGDGHLQAPGLIEHMAQTAAAQSGGVALATNTSPAIGFIGSVKNWIVHQLPAIGTTIDTTISIAMDLGQFLVIEATTTLQGHLVAQGEFKIFLAD